MGRPSSESWQRIDLTELGLSSGLPAADRRRPGRRRWWPSDPHPVPGRTPGEDPRNAALAMTWLLSTSRPLRLA